MADPDHGTGENRYERWRNRRLERARTVHRDLLGRLMSPREAAALIKDGMTIGTVGTPTSGCAVSVFSKRSSSLALLLPFVYPACPVGRNYRTGVKFEDHLTGAPLAYIP